LPWRDTLTTGDPSCGKSDTLPLCEDTLNDDYQPDHTSSMTSVVLLMLIWYSVTELMKIS